MSVEPRAECAKNILTIMYTLQEDPNDGVDYLLGAASLITEEMRRDMPRYRRTFEGTR